MKFIYENIIRIYNCCIAYLSGHEHGLQMLEDITNVTSNKDTFKFIISCMEVAIVVLIIHV